jgi:capsular exopolysaccharide synthesis family protein
MDLTGPVQSRSYPAEPPLVRDGMNEDSQGGLFDYWRILQRRKGTVILIAFLGLLVGVLITLPQTPVYQAHASLEIQDINQNFMNVKEMSPVNDTGAYAALTDIQTQIKILQSETLIERSTQKLRAVKPGELKNETGRIPAWRKALNLPSPGVVDERESSLRAAAGNLKVRAAGQTRIIELLFDSTNPKLAADFLNTLTNDYIDQNIEVRWQMSQRTADWLGRQLDDMRIKLERSEDGLQAYARQSGLLFTGDKQNVSEGKLGQLQTSLSAAQAERVARQSKWEIARAAATETLPDVLNDPSLREYQGKLADLRRQQAELIATYKPEYSKVKRVEAQIAEIGTTLERERKSILERIRHEFDEAQRREALLALDYATQARLVTADGEKSITYNILKREVDSNRQLYDAMLQKVKESSIASAMRASNARVVDPAKPPRAPYKPNLRTNAALGLLAGLFLGIAFVVMRERDDRTLQEPGDAPFWLNVPELGVVPSALSSRRLKMSHYYGRKELPVAKPEPGMMPVVKAGSANGSAEDRVELVTWQRKASMLAEAFRVVLASLLFTGNNGSRPRVLVMTSASAREGKTTVTANLGIALAEIRQKVLLIDADLRKPRLHEIFGLANEKGLSTLLMESPWAPELMEGIVQETKIPGLFLLPSGPATEAAVNLLYSATLPELLAQFKKEFDMVILDTPPMLQMPDARVIGRIADGVLLVFRAGQTTRDAAIAARQRFGEDETRVLGTILNGWDPKRSPNGYYGYSKGYGYKAYGYHDRG